MDFDVFWLKATARPVDVDFHMNARWPANEEPSERRWRDIDGHPFVNYEFC
ncbi:hypothetical protein AB0C34_16975 [Nocardia sp. NPDC049220]|uniref:hypothetical protein n=1 Tax=Nocardia sp. NPDC049220 TaxID=3155273 RepID=UPI0033FDA123